MLGNNVVYYWRKNKALQKALEANFKDLKISTVKEEIGRYVKKYKKKTAINPNQLAVEANKTLIKRRLKRKHLTDLIEEIR